MTSAFRFTKPQKVDPEAIDFWSVTSTEKDTDMEFRFFVASKNADGTNILYGQADSAFDALQLKKELSEELGKFLFVRAKRKEKVALADFSDETLDFFRDSHAEGVSLQDIPRPLRLGYLAFQRGRRSAR